MRTHVFLILVGTAATWLLIAGCETGNPGSTDEPDDMSPEEKQINEFCDTLLPPFCKTLHACCANEPRLKYDLDAGANPQECVANWKKGWCLQGITREDLKASLKAGTTVLDHGKLNECVTQFEKMAAGGDACIAPPTYVFFYSCFGAFRGQIPPGEACAAKLERDSFMQCKGGRCDQGKCVPFLKTGDACSSSSSLGWTFLTSDKFCNYIDGEWCLNLASQEDACGPIRKAGDACDYSDSHPDYMCTSHSCIDDVCTTVSTSYDLCHLY